jgi:hypothetical protein
MRLPRMTTRRWMVLVAVAAAMLAIVEPQLKLEHEFHISILGAIRSAVNDRGRHSFPS